MVVLLLLLLLLVLVFFTTTVVAAAALSLVSPLICVLFELLEVCMAPSSTFEEEDSAHR